MSGDNHLQRCQDRPLSASRPRTACRPRSSGRSKRPSARSERAWYDSPGTVTGAMTLDYHTARHMCLESIFVSYGVSVDPGERQADGAARNPVFCVVSEAAAGGRLKDRCRQVLSSLQRDGYAAIILRVSEGSGLLRLLNLLVMRGRVASAARTLRRAGAVGVAAYAVYGTPDRASLAYQLGTPAQSYAERHFLPSHRRGFSLLLWKVIRRLANCGPSLAAVVVVGKRP